MANVTTTDTFPKSSFTRADVEAERALQLAIPGAISSTITEVGENWILTTVLPGADDAAPVAAEPAVPNAPAPPRAPVAPPIPVAPPPSAGVPPPVSPGAGPTFTLGGLSTKFETGGRGSTTISGGVGDPGGVSYGTYQMASKPDGGAVARFVSQPDFPFRNDFAGLIPGSAEFSAKWRDIAGRFPENFKAAEHEFIKRGFFDPLCGKIQSDDGVDIMHCSHALQDVIWSTAVQHGPDANIAHLAFAQMRAAGTFGPASPQFDRNAIIAIYAERGRKDANGVLVHFSHSSPAVQNGVAQRFVQERADALKILDAGV
jgi:hypothetical protein